MEAPQEFKSLQEGIQKSLVSAVKTVNRIASEDLSFQRTINPDTAEQLDEQASRVLRLSTRLLQTAASACNVKAPALEDAEDIDMKWNFIVDVVDSVLEKADTALDEYTGIVKRREPMPAEPASASKKFKLASKAIRYANVSKPQDSFERKPDNFPTGPWKPILSKKPHAIQPLEKSLETFTTEGGSTQFKHPYEVEITKMEYPARLFEIAQPIAPQPAESTNAIWVDTYEGVLDMLDKLKEANEIAVDLEHHDFRTYTGIVCLMQVSTREQDWIVDTLQPWRHKLEVLNQVFADPNIVKVFHGAYMDMVWLQRDLGLYVNGLFDTFFACDLLSYPGKSLAFLLAKFVSFDADKQYQLADWRIRPIPKEMMYYARSDTHFLLYIYDCLRNELIAASNRSDPETDYIGRVLQRSRDLALSRHEHPDYDEETGQGSRGWYNFILKQAHLGFDGEQFAIFRALWKWRDETARQEDESPNYVLGTNHIIGIVRVDPPDVKALHSLLPTATPIARASLKDIWARLQEAKQHGGPSMLHYFAALSSDSSLKSGKPSSSIIHKSALPAFEGDVTIRSMSRSRLFGDMPISTRWEGADQPVEVDDVVPYPWQRFVQSTDAARRSISGGEIPIPSPLAESDSNARGADPDAMIEDQDEEFTLKRGKKRKSEAVEEEISVEDANNDEKAHSGSSGVVSTEEEVPVRSMKQRKKDRKEQVEEEQNGKQDEKAARKARKRLEKEQRKLEKAKKAEEAPFDYSKASSVLHAGRDAGSATRGTKKVFDHYAKTGDDGMKGARKAPPVRGERSATFKK
ncbi:hypothetical protein HIM_02769 [Hirsutella minnesotensis 3608]|nr:hypothetical protein HIM_02769 [Hirsutella minnesotensis 3608]